jgi:hypothetical protein
MANDKEPFEAVRATAQHSAERITEQTQQAMETYFNWLQTSMSASPWGYMDLNKRLLGYTNENVIAAVGLMQNLSRAKNFEDVVKIQTEFMSTQLNSFNQQAKSIGELYTKVAADAVKSPFSMSR